MISTLTGTELADRRRWRVEAQTVRGASGVGRSALELLAIHRLGKTGHRSVRTSNAITISSGERGNCVGEPAPAPSMGSHVRRLSLQPAKESLESCLGWFAVDLYLDGNQEIVAVVLDLWED